MRRILAIFVLVGLGLLPAGARAQQGSDARTIRYTMPVVSADGALLFFIGDGPSVDNLHFARVDGTDERRLTHDGASLPRWIGKPGEITFAGLATTQDSGRVFAMQPDGTARRLVAAVLGRNPVLSPDGEKVAYLRGPWATAEIWISNADSTNARRVAGGEIDRASAWNPAWSPDGTRLAYTFSDSSRRPQVHIVKVVGSLRDSAATDTLDHRMSSQMPSWSPDGSRIAVQWNTESGRGSRIAIIDVATRGLRVIDIPPPEGRASVQDEVPSWFPDGKRLVFQSDRSGNVDLWSMNEDGTDLRQLTGVRQR
jgi:Tol biopolymer transport system component